MTELCCVYNQLVRWAGFNGRVDSLLLSMRFTKQQVAEGEEEV
jgi:hypothetical protein